MIILFPLLKIVVRTFLDIKMLSGSQFVHKAENKMIRFFGRSVEYFPLTCQNKFNCYLTEMIFLEMHMFFNYISDNKLFFLSVYFKYS